MRIPESALREALKKKPEPALLEPYLSMWRWVEDRREEWEWSNPRRSLWPQE
jgi:hypothetical protein